MDTDMFDLFGDEPLDQSSEANKIQEVDLGNRAEEFHIPDVSSTDNNAWSFRLDAYARSPCLQRLAWSKTGLIGSLSTDQRTISLRAVCRDRKTKQWTLTDELHDPIQAPPGLNFTHIEWSGLGIDLLALDQHGHCHIFTLMHALNRFQPQKINTSNQSPSPATVVGTHWLPIHPQQFPTQTLGPLTWEDDEWHAKPEGVNVRWPHHPTTGKTALLIVTQSQLQIVYQQDGLHWSIASIALDEACEDVLTHAALANADEFLYMTTYSNTGRLRLYKVTIDWSVDNATRTMQPELSLTAVQVITRAIPQFKDIQGKPTCSPLTSIRILPTAMELESVNYQIVAVFSHVRNPGELPLAYTGYSSVVRWDIMENHVDILEEYLTIQSSGKSVPAENSTALSRLKDFRTRRILSSVQKVCAEDIMALVHLDGSIEYLDLAALERPAPLSDLGDQCNTWLLSAGFRLGAPHSHTDVILAPNGCMTASRTVGGDININAMQNILVVDEIIPDEGLKRRAIASVAREAAKLMQTQVSFDELFMLLPKPMTIDDRRYFAKQVFRMLRRPLDFCEEEQRKYMNNFLRDNLSSRALAVQLVHGYRDANGQPDPSGKLAYVALNLKSMTTYLAQTVSIKDNRAAGYVSLRFSVRWVIDLLILTVDDMTTSLQWRRKNMPQFELGTLNKHIDDTGSASILLLMSATTRHLLRMMLDLIKAYFIKIKEVVPQSSAEQIQLLELYSYSKNIPLQLPRLEFLLLDIDKRVRTAYTTGLTPQERIESELSMIVDGSIPECLGHVADYLTEEAAGKIMDIQDLSRVTFWDTDWLGLRDSANGDSWAQRRKHDIIKKSLIRPGARLRTCRRCGSVMEDIDLSPGAKDRNNVAVWLIQAQRTCICTGLWILERP